MGYRAELEMPFGEMSVTALWEAGDAVPTVAMRGGFFVPKLPQQMRVDFAYAIVGEVEASQRLPGLRLRLRIENNRVVGSPETGECLSAQSFVFGDQEVYVGTEDTDMLNRRYPWILLDGVWRDGFPRNGLDVAVGEIPRGALFSFHFVVAGQPVGRVTSDGEPDVSAWFAVDADHAMLKQLDLAEIPVAKIGT